MNRIEEVNAMDDNKRRALASALSQIEKQFGKGAVMRMGDRVDEALDVVSTGSLGLDIALGVGGLPRGRVVEIYGPESSGKTTLTLQVIAEMQKVGGTCAFVDAEHALDIQYAQKLGVNLQGVNDTLNDAFAQRQISTIYGQANQYRVVLEALPMYQRDPSILDKLYLPGALGAQVPLSAVATLTRTTAPLAISHQAQFPAVSLSFNLAPGEQLRVVGKLCECERRLRVRHMCDQRIEPRAAFCRVKPRDRRAARRVGPEAVERLE